MKIRSFPIGLMILVLFSANLTGCGGQPASPTLTPSATQTPTLAIPTQTATPTEPTLPPEVKEKFELAGVDLANMQNAKYDKDGLQITLPDEQVEVISVADLEKGLYLTEDNILQIRDEEGENVLFFFTQDEETKKWMINQTLTADQLAQMTPEQKLATSPSLDNHDKWRATGQYVLYTDQNGEVMRVFDLISLEFRDIPEYPVTKPEDFRQNKISVDELLNGDYFLSLQKLAKNLECSPTMRTDVPLINFVGRILYDQSNTPNFDVPGSEPFIRDYTSAYVQLPLADGQVVDYAVMPLFMCDLNDNTKVYPIMTVYSSYDPDVINQQKYNNLYMGGGIPRWRKDMAITVIITSDKLNDPGRSGVQDPLVAQVFAKYGVEEMKKRFDRYTKGDFEALSAPGIVLLNLIATPKDGSGRILDVYK